MSTYFSDTFEVTAEEVEAFGAYDISLVTDLPLFIDPFLLFNSEKPEYQALHDSIIRYLMFLKDKSLSGRIDDHLLKAWYCFPEVRQTWLGFTALGNGGRGLGMDFARALHGSLLDIFKDFGRESVTRGSHLEKVCLIKDGVGRDNISDFTTNLIKAHLFEFTERFALDRLQTGQTREVAVRGAVFNYDTEVWVPRKYVLPWIDGDYVVLTPKDMLTRDENWINRDDMIRGFEALPTAVPDQQLRSQVSNYFENVLARQKDREPSKKDIAAAAIRTIRAFPELVDYYIRFKEENGDRAANLSAEKVRFSEFMFNEQVGQLQAQLSGDEFYGTRGNTREEAHARLAYLKHVIEDQGGYRYFYRNGVPVQFERDFQIMYRLVWYGTPSDVTSEANDGRGPADFKVSRGARDKTIVEMKLAKNTSLRRNLEKQTATYQKASGAASGIKAIIYFSLEEHQRVADILEELNLTDDPDVVLIDARADNKPSGSKAS